MRFILGFISMMLLALGCETQKHADLRENSSKIRFEKIRHFKYPIPDLNQKPFKFRLTYYYENGCPSRWMELDSTGNVMTDYIYRYGMDWKQTGASYREEGEKTYAEERVRFKNDSTQVTEWIDSTGVVFYTMIDNLDKTGKTHRATFIGDTTHGYDSTFYTNQGFKKRIFFTNVKGKIYNDRSFEYDTINEMGDWTVRKKIMNDSVVEYQMREVYYDTYFASQSGQFYEGVISTADWDENVISFTENEDVMFFTRTKNWTNQTGYLTENKNGLFTTPKVVDGLENIYNGAISPDGKKIIYSLRSAEKEDIWIVERVGDEWTNKVSLSSKSDIEGGYFNWLSNEILFFYIPHDNGDIVEGSLIDGELSITDSLSIMNTKKATEFSPFVDRNKRFIIFSRYLEGYTDQQGFFISYNENNRENPKWTVPEKIPNLPYGWSAYVNKDLSRFIFSDGSNINSIPFDSLGLKIGH